MRKRDLDKFKKRLDLERQSIVHHLAKLQGESEEGLAASSGDSVDLASVEISQAAIQKLGNREKKLLKKIDHALSKFETSDYGACERCGEGISPARLEARPVAQYCIDCKNELEQNERRYGDAEGGADREWQSEEFDDGF